MADIRISALPNEPTPSGSDFVAIDLATTRKTTVTLLTEAGRPTASQAEAEAGTDPTKAMTPLTVKQAITFQGSTAYQPLDADLTALAALGTTGLAARTAANTWTNRTVTGTANQITVTDGGGVAGNPTLALAGNTASLSGLTLAAGDLLYSTGVGTIVRLAIGSVNQVLQVNGGAPVWQNVAGTGDVVGPASAVNNNLTAFNTTTGKLIKDSGIPILDILPLASTKGYLYGLNTSNNGTDAVNDIDIAAGIAASDDPTSPRLMTLAAAMTKRLDAAWTVGTGNGGLDTGAVANGTYHIWEIARSDTGVVDVCFSLSATSPTFGGAIPVAYDRKRRIWSIVRSGATILGYKQDGNDAWWNNRLVDVNVANPGTAAVTRTLTVPTGIRVKANVRGSINNNISGSICLLLSDLSITDTVPANANCDALYESNGAIGFTTGYGNVSVYTNTSAQIRSRVQFSDATTAVSIQTIGWTDTRGQT